MVSDIDELQIRAELAEGFSPAANVGETATANLAVGATTPAGVYAVEITASNGAPPTSSCAMSCN